MDTENPIPEQREEDIDYIYYYFPLTDELNNFFSDELYDYAGIGTVRQSSEQRSSGSYRSFSDYYRPRYSMGHLFEIFMGRNILNEVQNQSLYEDTAKIEPVKQEDIDHVIDQMEYIHRSTLQENDQECPICYKEYEDDTKIKKHSQCCNNHTCENCIRRFLKEKLKCPYCMCEFSKREREREREREQESETTSPLLDVD